MPPRLSEARRASIYARLHTPDLSNREIADAEGISVQYVRRYCDNEGITIANVSINAPPILFTPISDPWTWWDCDGERRRSDGIAVDIPSICMPRRVLEFWVHLDERLTEPLRRGSCGLISTDAVQMVQNTHTPTHTPISMVVPESKVENTDTPG
jgi:hypothetical protein